MAAHLRRQEERNTIIDHSEKVFPCDGREPALVKQFLRELELVPQNYRLLVFERVARGALLREGLNWGQDHPGLQDPLRWTRFKEHLIAAFVSQDTEGTLKKELFRCSRAHSESLISYNRRFRELVAEAYPLGHDAQGQAIPRNADQVETLVKAYAAGLKDRKLAAKIITPEWPATIEEAMARTAITEKQEDSLQRLGYGKEPMEVGMMASAAPLSSEVHHLKTQYGKLERKIDRLLENKASPRGQGPRQPKQLSNRGGQGRQATTGEKRTCFYCGRVGHIKRDCRKLQRERQGGVPDGAIAAVRTSQ